MNFIINKKILLILFVGITLRLFSIYFYGDVIIDNEWGIMLNNLEKNNILSVRSIDGVPVPNIFMPPLYPIFLYIIKIPFSNTDIFLKVILLIQLLISIISILIAHKIFLELFNPNQSYLGTIIFTLFPLNIYAVSQISSITLQMFLINIFLLSIIKLLKNYSIYYSLGLSISSALLILLRGEFFVFVIFSLIFLLFKQKNFFKIFLTTLIIGLLVFPYIYRNYNIFGIVTVTKSSGYNLLKGNHPNTAVEGVGMFGQVEKVVPAVKGDLEQLYKKGPVKNHDLLKDQILMNQAIKFIKEDPKKYIKLYFKKFFSFLFIDFNSTYPNYYSILHILPKILLSISTLIGIILITNYSMNIANYFVIFYLANIGLFSFFFILPRYSLFLLTIQIVLSLFAIEKIKDRVNDY